MNQWNHIDVYPTQILFIRVPTLTLLTYAPVQTINICLCTDPSITPQILFVYPHINTTHIRPQCHVNPPVQTLYASHRFSSPRRRHSYKPHQHPPLARNKQHHIQRTNQQCQDKQRHIRANQQCQDRPPIHSPPNRHPLAIHPQRQGGMTVDGAMMQGGALMTHLQVSNCLVIFHLYLRISPNQRDVLWCMVQYSLWIQWNLTNTPTGLAKSDLNWEVTVLQGANLHCGIQFGTEPGWP